MVPQSFLKLALAFSASSAGAVSINKRITGGEEAREGEFPSVVRLGTNCAGILLDSTTVLTAEHCAGSDSFDVFEPIPVIKAGVVNLADSGVVSEYIKLSSDQKKLAKLPLEKNAFTPNDIAIMKLVTPIKESATIKYAKLPKADSDPKVNSTAVAVGWGAQGERDDFQGLIGVQKLSKIVIPVHPRQTCIDLEAKVGDRDTILCAGGDGKALCGQDSGGPLFDQETGELIGVASFILPDKNGKFCDKAPAVFTRVASYMAFIKANLGGDGGLPTPDYAWTRRATVVLEKSCRDAKNNTACLSVVQPCLTEAKMETKGETAATAATATSLGDCAQRNKFCSLQEGSQKEKCIENVKACVKQERERPFSFPWAINACYSEDTDEDE